MDATETPEITRTPPSARQRTVAPGPGLLHALGLTALLVSEWARRHARSAGESELALDPYLREVARTSADLADAGFYRFVADLFDTLCLGQPRLGLWAAVYVAIVVRLNRRGPHRLQNVLSRLAATYCLLGYLTLLPVLIPLDAGFFLLPGICAAAVWLVTR
ncbi:hypothetical protein [Streptomyces hoynatensis]|uniref:hypothetical protein n=1 Tax=Streptomyces hoynatensis TaxID=1141874 RepID=UPI0011C46E1F|nr:hypothetical protein [Streptomyces hoynatensis]